MQSYKDFLLNKSQAGTACGFAPIFLPDWLKDFQHYGVDWAVRKGRAALLWACGMGKAQRVDQRILTDNGWIEIGSAHIGQQVFGSDGKPHSILGVYPQGMRDLAKVSFNDGTSVVCDWDHLWYVRSQSQAWRGLAGRTLTTSQLLACGIQFAGGQKKHFVPLVQPLDYPHRTHLIDPYTFGVLLGDGCLTLGTCKVTCPDFAFTQEELPLPDGCWWSDVTQPNHCREFSIVAGESRFHKTNPLTQELKRLGVHGCRAEAKFIPHDYLFSSPGTRWAVLQGLLDTDGHASGPCVEYSTASSQLSDDVVFLARSLGGTATQSCEHAHYTKDGERHEALDKYRSVIKLPEAYMPFRLKRKRDQYNPIQCKHPFKAITAIEPAGSGEAVCIRVDATDQLYITEGMTLTHNTPCQLVWAENVRRYTNRPVLVMAPLAVSAQTVREANKFGIDCRQSRDGTVHPNITVTNYEKIHLFSPDDFSGVVLDEAQAIKSFEGKRRKQVTRFLSKMQFRLACTATPAPNEFIELGTISEAIGELSQSEMLSMFFRASDNKRHSLFKEGDFWNRAKYFFRAHSESPFWRWVCSWARACHKPSDLGPFDDTPFVLPQLNVNQHVVDCKWRPPGELFIRIAKTLKEQREERKQTMAERCEKVVELVANATLDAPAVVWGQYNAECDLLEKMIPGAVQVAGCNSDDEKEERLLAFTCGQVRVLVSKPKCASLGLNWQHCGHQTFFPSHSFESVYQAIRRSLRFGRIGPVNMDIVATPGEAGVMANLEKKQRKNDEMFANLVDHMNDSERVRVEDKHTSLLELPAWL